MLPLHKHQAVITSSLAPGRAQCHPKRAPVRLEAMPAAQALGLAGDVDLEALKEDAVAWASQHGLVRTTRMCSMS